MTSTKTPAKKPPAKMPAKPSGLGKGLDALIPPAAGDRADMLPLGNIIPAPDNVRADIGDLGDLADSIAELGLLQPLVVRPLDGDDVEVVAGHRRLAAIDHLVASGRWPIGRPVPVQIRVVLDDRTRLAMMLVENLHRADLNPIEEATGYFRLTTEFGMTQRDLAAKVSRSQAHISQRIALLKLPDLVQGGIRGGEIGVDIALRLTKLPDKVVLDLTRKGTSNPSPYDIQAAENRLAADTATAEFRKRLTDIGVQIIPTKNTWERPNGYTMTRSLARPAELAGLHGLEPDVDVAVLVPNNTGGNCRCDIYRPTLTPDIVDQGGDSDDVELSPHEREVRAWKAECARLRSEHAAAVAAYEAAERDMLAAWARQQTAKDVARWAMLSLLGEDWAIVASNPRIDVVLGLPTATLGAGDPVRHGDSAAVLDAVRSFAHQSAANLVTVCALIAREWEDTDATIADVETSWSTFTAGAAKPSLTLPPHPGSTPAIDDEAHTADDLDGNDDLEDGEAEAIRATKAAADEAARLADQERIP